MSIFGCIGKHFTTVDREPGLVSLWLERPRTSWQKDWWGLDNNGTMYLHSVLLDGVSNSSDTSSTKLYTFLLQQGNSSSSLRQEIHCSIKHNAYYYQITCVLLSRT